MEILRSPIFVPMFKEKARFSHSIVENCAKIPGVRLFFDCSEKMATRYKFSEE